MVVSQNSKQAAMNPRGYSYTLYDALGRVTEAGEIKTNSTLATDGTGSRNSSGQYYYFDIVSATALTTWLGTGTKNDVTSTYYDKAPSLTNSDAPAAFPNGQENLRNRVSAVVYDDNPTAQHDLYNFSATQAGYLNAYFYSYDIHGNVKQVVQETPPLKTHNQNIKTTTYEYDLVSGNVNAVHYQSGQRDEFHHKYEYDADNRLKVAYTSRDGQHWEKESKQFYYKTGGVTRVEIGDKTVQAMDYVFTINGWLKGMNRNTIGNNGSYQERDLGQDGVNNANNINRNIATDAAGFALHYYQPTTGVTKDYTAIFASTPAFEADMASTAYGSGITNQYNGNIAGMSTAMQKNDQAGAEVQGRAFTYDQLYRIKSSLAYHMNSTALTNNAWQSSYTQDNRYKETFTYDWNGNIKTVERYDGTATTAVKTDGFTYNYAANSNLLTGIDDTQNACTYADDIDDQNVNNYLYDAIGEMTDDVSERITDIEWTPYGKVKAVRKDQANNTNTCTSSEYTDADVEFLYTAGQQRLCKIIKPHKPNGAGIEEQDSWIYYWYQYDAGGNLMGVYKQSFEDLGSNSYKVHIDLEEHGVYGSGRTGMRHADDESDYYQAFTATMTGGKFNTPSYTGNSSAYNKTHYTRTIGYKQYEVANHLGNVLVTVSDKRLLYSATPSTATQVDWYVADVQSYGDYYVFGAMQTGRAGGSYRYGFNGKENDDEINNVKGSWQDYGMRMYDPRVGRFFSSDPLKAIYPHYTPYQFAGNKPISFIDLDGCEEAPPGTESKSIKTPDGGDMNVVVNMKVSDSGHALQGEDGTIWEWQWNNADDHSAGGFYYIAHQGTGTVGDPHKIAFWLEGGNYAPGCTTSVVPAHYVFMEMESVDDAAWTRISGAANQRQMDAYMQNTYGTVGTWLRGTDDWANGSGGQAVGQAIANAIPLIAAANLVSGTIEGTDIYGQDMNGVDYLINGVTCLAFLPVGSGTAGTTQRLVGYGNDAAIVENAANLTPKSGWFDVVVHGAEDGMGFVVNGQATTAEQLHATLLSQGYQQGTRIRLVSCYAGSVEGGAAQQLSNLTGATVVAPTNTAWVSKLAGGKMMVDGGGVYKVFTPK